MSMSMTSLDGLCLSSLTLQVCELGTESGRDSAVESKSVRSLSVPRKWRFCRSIRSMTEGATFLWATFLILSITDRPSVATRFAFGDLKRGGREGKQFLSQ